jgi:hypothetical protein
MSEYSIIKAPYVWEKADLSFHTTEVGACLFCYALGALVIDLIFTSKIAMVKAFVLCCEMFCCDVDGATGGNMGDIPLPSTIYQIICV